MASNFRNRLFFSSLAIISLTLITLFSFHPFLRFLFMFALAGVVGVAVWEYYNLLKGKGTSPLTSLGIAASCIFTIMTFFGIPAPQTVELSMTLFVVVLALGFAYYLYRGTHPLENLTMTFFALLYLAIPLSYLIKINYFFLPNMDQDGRWWFFYLIAVTKTTDIGGYCIGKRCGGKKLAPYTSPQKTWEGAIGGLCTALFVSILFHIVTTRMFLSPPIILTLSSSVLLGITLSVLALFGDLAESLIKRDAGVKDSNQIPGLGGVLDSVDSLVFTAPLLYIFLFGCFS